MMFARHVPGVLGGLNAGPGASRGSDMLPSSLFGLVRSPGCSKVGVNSILMRSRSQGHVALGNPRGKFTARVTEGEDSLALPAGPGLRAASGS